MPTMTGQKRDFDSAARTWDDNPARVKLAHDVARAIRDTIKLTPDMEVLDFGCGTGLLTLRLQREVRCITGMDSSPGMLEVLNKKIGASGITNVKTTLFNPENAGSLKGEYDLVVSSMTFHHIPEMSSMVNILHSHIRPGGMLGIADLDREGGRFHDSNVGVHHFGFDRAMLKKEIETAGFLKIRNRTAAIIHKSSPVCQERSFTVFLMTAEKSDLICQ
ncbi:MAG: class I SAM-dependent methyltransferase [Methanoregula sp.]|jgi:2-polyprenyl-3-methyl-5-hydroxy-6-metoxy-1,4-benzoquinol methylase|nr:class I SAM-dependent methyltransferase [Methanoregula sp.]